MASLNRTTRAAAWGSRAPQVPADPICPGLVDGHLRKGIKREKREFQFTHGLTLRHRHHRAGHLDPGQIAIVAPGQPPRGVDGKQMQPAVVEQIPHPVMALEDICHRLARGLDADRQAQRIMGEALAVMDRLPGQAGAQCAAIALHHADPAGDVVQKLVARPERIGRDGGAVILQADPARHHHGRGHDQLQHAEILVLFPVVVVQEGPALKAFAAGPAARGGDEGLAARQRPFRPCLRPVAGAISISVARRPRQAQRALAPCQAARLPEPRLGLP
jgi:hypothetical protein